MDQSHIRNFSIIAHIDHGKSTLADRILELTNAVSARDMREQVLDTMDLERERGITIKAQAVRVDWKGYQLNLIDTPGHVDFTYEVSRSLQACEGALLVVDAAQGTQAQTLANAYLAIENDLDIVPVVNKIDLPQADPDGAAHELADLIGDTPEHVLRISAKTGEGVADVLDAIVERVPPPGGDPQAPARALIFDSSYDQYRGVVAFVRVVDGTFSRREPMRAMALGTHFEAEELGFFAPTRSESPTLEAGEVGYVITGLKDVSRLRVGDTITSERRPAAEPVPGYKDVKPMVFAGLFPTDSDDYPELRDALEKLKLNDSALYYEPETCQALVDLTYELPLAEIVLDYYDRLKSRARGYASFDYDVIGCRPGKLVRVDILVGGEPVDALSLVLHRDSAYERGRALVERLREEIPRQLFDVAIQAAIGSRVIARETVKAKRKDVLAKCYGGDITRKRKLIERQKAGKRRMKQVGMVEVPQEAFLAVLNLNGERK